MEINTRYVKILSDFRRLFYALMNSSVPRGRGAREYRLFKLSRILVGFLLMKNK